MTNALPENNKPVILLVEDDKPTRILLRSAIEKWDYQVKDAADGESAWTLLGEASPPQILIIDWIMPHLSGVELCERIRKKSPPEYNPYIILLTQTSGSENIVTGLEAGANEFLTKPVNLIELKSRIGVGEKIVSYENQLSAQNTQLKNYITSIEAANKLAKSASESLGHAMKANLSDEFPEKTTPDFQSLEKADANLNDILNIFSEFKPEADRKRKK